MKGVKHEIIAMAIYKRKMKVKLSRSEKRTLRQWLNEHPDNKKFYDQTQDPGYDQRVKESREWFEENKERLWSKIKDKS
jgi:hypothetical protein